MNLYLNCLKGKHRTKDCVAGNCKRCSKKHSTLLHDGHSLSKGDKVESTNKVIIPEENTNRSVEAICTHAQSAVVTRSMQVLLSTVMIKVKNHKGHYIEGRALLDSGSQSNFVTKEFAKQLI